MKPSGLLAVVLSAAIPGGAFAQNLSASRGRLPTASGSGAASPYQLGIGAAPLLRLELSFSAPSIEPGLAPVPGITPAVHPSAVAAGSAVAMPLLPAAHAAARPTAAARQVKPSALIPAALHAAPSAEAKNEKSSSKAWTEKVASMFDGGAKKPADETPLDPASLRAFVVRHGESALSTTPEMVPGALMSEPGLLDEVAKKGQVRLLTAKNDPSGLTAKHADQVGAILRGGGVRAAVQQEQLAVDWSPKAAATARAAETRGPSSLASKLLWPFREAKFLAKTFMASLVKPLPSEILGGIATKSFPLVTAITVYWATIGPAHPLILAGLIALSAAQEIFHGFFLKSWNNFQESLRSARGFNYQMFFNLAYMQGFGTLYRLLSWSANPATVTPPWSVLYWKDMAVMSVVGTFFGVLGYNSLNALYAKGAIKRWQHSGIQQVRDLCFLLAAPFFASGSMTVFWSIFIFQQALDLAIAIWAGRAKARPIVFVTSDAVAGSAEFKNKYPLEGVVIEPPLKQAAKAVVDNPLVRLLTWPVRALWKLVRGGGK